MSNGARKFSTVRENSMFCYGPLVSELGGPECMVPPQPRHWGPVPPGPLAYAMPPMLRGAHLTGLGTGTADQ